MIETVAKGANLTLAFLLELCILAALGYWGFVTAGSMPAKFALGLGAPLLVAVVWGLFLAPQATITLAQPWNALLRAAVFLAAALALAAAGHTTLAWVFVLAVAANQMLLVVWKQ